MGLFARRAVAFDEPGEAVLFLRGPHFSFQCLCLNNFLPQHRAVALQDGKTAFIAAGVKSGNAFHTNTFLQKQDPASGARPAEP